MSACTARLTIRIQPDSEWRCTAPQAVTCVDATAVFGAYARLWPLQLTLITRRVHCPYSPDKPINKTHQSIVQTPPQHIKLWLRVPAMPQFNFFWIRRDDPFAEFSIVDYDMANHVDNPPDRPTSLKSSPLLFGSPPRRPQPDCESACACPCTSVCHDLSPI